MKLKSVNPSHFAIGVLLIFIYSQGQINALTAWLSASLGAILTALTSTLPT